LLLSAITLLPYLPLTNLNSAAYSSIFLASITLFVVGGLKTRVAGGRWYATSSRSSARNRLVIYPFAHLNQNLAKPPEALLVLKAMEKAARDANIETYRAPFGWSKAPQVKVRANQQTSSLSKSRGPCNI
jgi:hypothetical protein